jgi:hypothetical protein
MVIFGNFPHFSGCIGMNGKDVHAMNGKEDTTRNLAPQYDGSTGKAEIINDIGDFPSHPIQVIPCLRVF